MIEILSASSVRSVVDGQRFGPPAKHAPVRLAKHTRSGLSVGSVLPRSTLIEIALMSSDNHAAAALARTYPDALVEPTGWSPDNHATAHDMAKIPTAASTYPEIVRATRQSSSCIAVSGPSRMFHNTNHFVGRLGWNISVSKTSFTQVAPVLNTQHPTNHIT